MKRQDLSTISLYDPKVCEIFFFYFSHNEVSQPWPDFQYPNIPERPWPDDDPEEENDTNKKNLCYYPMNSNSTGFAW